MPLLPRILTAGGFEPGSIRPSGGRAGAGAGAGGAQRRGGGRGRGGSVFGRSSWMVLSLHNSSYLPLKPTKTSCWRTRVQWKDVAFHCGKDVEGKFRILFGLFLLGTSSCLNQLLQVVTHKTCL